MALLSSIRTVLHQLKKEESGQSLVLVVLAMTVIMGCASLAIDTGRVHIEQIKVQNATDMAALAAVKGFPNLDSTKKYAKDYANKNCEELTNIQVDYINGSDTVTVTCTKEVSFTFARVIGYNSTTVTATAQAKKASTGGGEAPASKCYAKTVVDQHRPPEGGRNTHIFHFQTTHDSSWDTAHRVNSEYGHIADNQIAIVHFSQPVKIKACYANGFKVIGGDGTDTLIISMTYHQNVKNDNIGYGDLEVTTSASTLECEWAVTLCIYDPLYESIKNGSIDISSGSGGRAILVS